VVALRFVDSVAIAGEVTSVSVGGTSPNVSTIQPGRLEADGSVVAISANQRADGWLVTRKYTDRAANKAAVEAVFVPFANVRTALLGE
jgi:hypothetical protein